MAAGALEVLISFFQVLPAENSFPAKSAEIAENPATINFLLVPSLDILLPP
jgi:hypothetical protein